MLSSPNLLSDVDAERLVEHEGEDLHDHDVLLTAELELSPLRASRRIATLSAPRHAHSMCVLDPDRF